MSCGGPVAQGGAVNVAVRSPDQKFLLGRSSIQTTERYLGFSRNWR